MQCVCIENVTYDIQKRNESKCNKQQTVANSIRDIPKEKPYVNYACWYICTSQYGTAGFSTEWSLYMFLCVPRGRQEQERHSESRICYTNWMTYSRLLSHRKVLFPGRTKFQSIPLICQHFFIYQYISHSVSTWDCWSKISISISHVNPN